MKLTSVLLAASSCLRAVADGQQIPLLVPESKSDVKNVAIIGAGAAGASSAYHLAKFAASADIPINITVFERNSYVGGRSTTVDAYDDPTLPVELGASIFVEVNRILVNAAKEFNLTSASHMSTGEILGAALAVWNGQELVYSQAGHGGWWNTAKLIWKYGLAPVWTSRLVTEVVGKFLKMYDEPVFPFSSLTQTAQDLGLLAVTAATGAQYLEEHGITGKFTEEILQASTRVNYAQNLDYIHGLEAMVCGATEKPRSIEGGNWRIFDSMVKASKATTLLETVVTSIETAKHGRYHLHTKDMKTGLMSHSMSQAFDAVVLAGPYQFSNISVPHLTVVPDEVPYVQLYTTLFASPHLLSPKFFNLDADKPAPRVVLTTLPKREKPLPGPEGVGSPGFFSISLLDPVTNPQTGGQDYLYKIFSASPPNSTFLADLLGLESPESDHGGEISDKDITWDYRQIWHSYPYEYPRVTFERLQLDDGLYYTGGMDSFISTMETNALMGKNVARLIVDGLLSNNEKSTKKDQTTPALPSDEL